MERVEVSVEGEMELPDTEGGGEPESGLINDRLVRASNLSR